jgi:hypothetical protein
MLQQQQYTLPAEVATAATPAVAAAATAEATPIVYIS